MKQETATYNRIYWQCRRGMRELDELLLGFLNRDYDQLDQRERDTFAALLTTNDNQLLEYLMGRTPPRDEATARVIDKIRAAARPGS
jgi:antitoxin CptB